jgi:hypothetical protein
LVVGDDDRKWEFTAERISVAMAGYGDELKREQEGLACPEEERRDGHVQKEEGQHGIEERSVARVTHGRCRGKVGHGSELASSGGIESEDRHGRRKRR